MVLKVLCVANLFSLRVTAVWLSALRKFLVFGHNKFTRAVRVASFYTAPRLREYLSSVTGNTTSLTICGGVTGYGFNNNPEWPTQEGV